MIPATSPSLALARAVLPSSHPFQTQLEGLSFQPLTLLKSPSASHLSSFPCLPHTRHKLPAFIFKALLFSLPSHLSFSTQWSTPIPKLPKSSPKHQHQLLEHSQHCIFCPSASSPGRMFPFNIYISTLQISLSAEFLNSLKRKDVLVLLKSLIWTGIDSPLFETHPSPGVGSPSAIPLALH